MDTARFCRHADVCRPAQAWLRAMFWHDAGAARPLVCFAGGTLGVQAALFAVCGRFENGAPERNAGAHVRGGPDGRTERIRRRLLGAKAAPAAAQRVSGCCTPRQGTDAPGSAPHFGRGRALWPGNPLRRTQTRMTPYCQGCAGLRVRCWLSGANGLSRACACTARPCGQRPAGLRRTNRSVPSSRGTFREDDCGEKAFYRDAFFPPPFFWNALRNACIQNVS